MQKATNFNDRALLTSAQMRQAEERACRQEGVRLYDLMQKAGHAVAHVIRERWQPCPTVVLCGPGNNGGDGYVIAQALREAGWPVVVGAMPSKKTPPDAARAAAAWQGETKPLAENLFDTAGLIVDALFGIGLQRPLDGDVARIVEGLNARALPVVAVDVPSGTDADTGKVLGTAVRATVTVTFFRKKIGHVLLPGAEHSGEVVLADIGIPSSVLNAIEPKVAENDPALWLAAFPFPQAVGHKYTRGHALVYGGPAMTGASRLAVRAAQRLGAGLVTLAAKPEAAAFYAAALESVLIQRVDSEDAWRTLVNDTKKNVLLIGPGAGVNEMTRSFVLAALESRKPCVLDADALTVFAEKPEILFNALHPLCILTPHEGEFSRLFGAFVDSKADKFTRACEAAKRAGCVVLLKGSDTVLADSDGQAMINHNAPPWLATAGAGDVLAGMMAGLLAQGMPPLPSAAAAAWLHGKIAADFGPGLIAEDLVSGVPDALRDLSAFM